MIEFSLHMAVVYLICAPERPLVWWVVAAVVCLVHAGKTLAWFRREHAVQGFHAPAAVRENRTHVVDPRKPIRV